LREQWLLLLEAVDFLTLDIFVGLDDRVDIQVGHRLASAALEALIVSWHFTIVQLTFLPDAVG